MSRLLALAALAAAMLVATLAQADASKFPDPRFSSADPVLVGSPNGTHTYRVVLRTFDNAPSRHRMVTLDFSATTIRLSTTQDPGVTLDCAQKTLSQLSGNDGSAIFHPRFAGCANGRIIPVMGDGMPITAVYARSTDLDGMDGRVGLGDFAIFGPLFIEGSRTHPEADFNLSGGPIDLGDFAIFAADYLAAGQATYCP